MGSALCTVAADIEEEAGRKERKGAGAGGREGAFWQSSGSQSAKDQNERAAEQLL